MKQTINKSQFMDEFKKMDRATQFSYGGLSALFDYLEDFDENYELDVIALCCEYAEYKDLLEFQNDYNERQFPDMESIKDETTVIEFESGFIVQSF